MAVRNRSWFIMHGNCTPCPLWFVWSSKWSQKCKALYEQNWGGRLPKQWMIGTIYTVSPCIQTSTVLINEIWLLWDLKKLSRVSHTHTCTLIWNYVHVHPLIPVINKPQNTVLNFHVMCYYLYLCGILVIHVYHSDKYPVHFFHLSREWVN